MLVQFVFASIFLLHQQVNAFPEYDLLTEGPDLIITGPPAKFDSELSEDEPDLTISESQSSDDDSSDISDSEVWPESSESLEESDENEGIGEHIAQCFVQQAVAFKNATISVLENSIKCAQSNNEKFLSKNSLLFNGPSKEEIKKCVKKQIKVYCIRLHNMAKDINYCMDEVEQNGIR